MARPVSGETLANVLRKSGMSKAELARRMGVTPPTVASWTKSERIPSKRVRRLRRILGPLTAVNADGDVPVLGRVLSEVMDRKGISNSDLAKRMGVTVPAVAYWQKAETVPVKRIQELQEILGPELMGGSGAKPSVRTLKKRFEDLRSEYGVSVRELGDLAELSAPAIHNVFVGQTKSPREQTLRRLEEGLGELQAKYEEGDAKPIESEECGDESAGHGKAFVGQDIHVHNRHSNTVDKIDAAGVYLLYGDHAVTHREEKPEFHGSPEYVGQTENVGKRMRQYDPYWWFKGVDWIAYIEEDDRKQRLRIERLLIRLLNPQFNKQRPS